MTMTTMTSRERRRRLFQRYSVKKEDVSSTSPGYSARTPHSVLQNINTSNLLRYFTGSMNATVQNIYTMLLCWIKCKQSIIDMYLRHHSLQRNCIFVKKLMVPVNITPLFTGERGPTPLPWTRGLGIWDLRFACVSLCFSQMKLYARKSTP